MTNINNPDYKRCINYKIDKDLEFLKNSFNDKLNTKILDKNFYENLIDMEFELKEKFTLNMLQNVINSYTVSKYIFIGF